MSRGVAAARLRCAFLLLAAVWAWMPATAAKKPAGLNIGVLAHVAKADDSLLREALADADAERLAFIVVNGIKLAGDACSDELYQQRESLLASVKSPVIVSLAASDWTDCRTAQQQPAAMERLNRLRELLFADGAAFEDGKLAQLRQSNNAKFRNFVENARWEMGGVQFATVNLPANNNHYLPDAGRNSEFEDRLIATSDWLQRVVNSAARRKLNLIVLFCDGNPVAPAEPPPLFGRPAKRDGFREVRKKITTLAASYKGKILVVHADAAAAGEAPATIRWQKNVGTLAAAQTRPGAWVRLNIGASGSSIRAIPMMPAAAGEKERGK